MAAQRAFKPVNTALKAKNYKEAVNQVNKLRQDSLYKNDAQLCLYSMEAYKGLNDGENTKLYLKRSYDTVAFFNTTLQIVQEAARLDSIRRNLEQENKNAPAKWQKTSVSYLQRYFPNLHPGAIFFYQRKKYPEAMSYLRTCIDLPQTETGKAAQLTNRLAVIQSSLYLTAAFNSKNYAEVHRYEQQALEDSASRATVMECLTYTAEAENDTAQYRHWLQEGMAAYPQHTLFFTRLADLYASRRDFTSVLHIAQTQLERDSADVSALAGRCMAQLNLVRLDDCITTGQLLLQADSTNTEAHYYIGAAYVGKAAQVELPLGVSTNKYRKALQQQQSLYRQAETYLEAYRKLAPQAQKRWAPLLYKVYLALNEGDKFAEIEKMLQWLNE